jgi:hypothetical protein
VKSQSYLVNPSQGIDLSAATASLFSVIGSEGDLITSLQAVQQGSNILLTVFYKTSYEKAMNLIMPAFYSMIR